MPHISFRLRPLLQLIALLQSAVKSQRLIDLFLSTVLILGALVSDPVSLGRANATENGDRTLTSERSVSKDYLEPDEILPVESQSVSNHGAQALSLSVDEPLSISTTTDYEDVRVVLEQSVPEGDIAAPNAIAQVESNNDDPEVTPPSLDEPLSVPMPEGDRPVLTPEILNSIMEQPNSGAPPEFDVYRLGPGDGIFVSVQRFPDLSFQATLDLQGNVIIPIEGSVNLEGFTLAQAQAQIRQIYNQYVVDPEVDLTLTAQRPVEVTILGEVVRPGFYPLPAPQISTALLASGGATGFSDLRSVHIRRRLPDGQVIETEVDLFTPLADGDAIPDLRLEDGDVMTIPRLDLSELDEYDRYLVSRSTLAREAITIRALNYAAGGGINANFGAVQLPNGSRLLDAVTATGVNPDNANFRQVALIRFDPEQGTAVTMRFNMFSALEGDLSQNPPLQNNDVVIANRNFINRITFALNTFTQPFRDTLGFLLFFDSLSDAADDLFRP
ncbi:MAG: polysaccharide biosynthesis/export family protein [Cyanobacteria bacterium J06635_15]